MSIVYDFFHFLVELHHLISLAMVSNESSDHPVEETVASFLELEEVFSWSLFSVEPSGGLRVPNLLICSSAAEGSRISKFGFWTGPMIDLMMSRLRIELECVKYHIKRVYSLWRCVEYDERPHG